MSIDRKREALIAAAVAAVLGFTATSAEASHFRGAALVPEVDANGLITIVSTSFWRPAAVDQTFVTVNGFGAAQQSNVQDTSDSRFTKVTQVFTFQAGTGSSQVFNIEANSCCRVSGIQNRSGPNAFSTSVSWQMNSRLVWDGSGSYKPISFNLSAVQPEVVRGTTYSNNLGASGGVADSGVGTVNLSYNNTLNDNFSAGTFVQTPGYTISGTGQMNIPSVNTATMTDNDGGNPGADYLFSGNILADDNVAGSSSFVEFDWLWDAVDTGTAVNSAPVVSDHEITIVLGGTAVVTVTGTDPNDTIADDVLLSLLSFSGPGINLSPNFVPGPAGDPTTGLFTWDSTGSVPGDYVAIIQADDGPLTDTGNIIIHVVNATVPEPATLGAMGLGLAAMGAAAAARRRRKS